VAEADWIQRTKLRAREEVATERVEPPDGKSIVQNELIIPESHRSNTPKVVTVKNTTGPLDDVYRSTGAKPLTLPFTIEDFLLLTGALPVVKHIFGF